MAFKKGQSGNPSGKPKGTKNKTSELLRGKISQFIEMEFKAIQKDFKKLSPKDRAKLFIDLVPFVVPKLQSVSMDLNLEKLTEDQLDQIINELKSRANEQQEG